MADSSATSDRPAGHLLGVAPGLPTTDMARTVQHYQRLGFSFSAPGSPSIDAAEFAIAERDGLELHFALKPDHDPARTATWVYLHVDDADRIAAEFEAAGVELRQGPRETDYRMRELALVDPDNNVLLFGSPPPEAR